MLRITTLYFTTVHSEIISLYGHRLSTNLSREDGVGGFVLKPRNSNVNAQLTVDLKPVAVASTLKFFGRNTLCLKRFLAAR